MLLCALGLAQLVALHWFLRESLLACLLVASGLTTYFAGVALRQDYGG